jgi:hypothetical protein
MRAVPATADFPWMTPVLFPVKIPFIPGCRIIKINPGACIQSMSPSAQTFIPAVTMKKILIDRRQIRTVVPARFITNRTGMEEIVRRHTFQSSDTIPAVYAAV